MGYLHNQSIQKQTRRVLRQDQTSAEQYLWNALRNKQLGVRFRRQHSVGLYILDFYCPTYHLAIEVDGSVHDSDTAKKHDEVRTDFLNKMSIQVMRFSNEDIYQRLEWVLETIRKQVALR